MLVISTAGHQAPNNYIATLLKREIYHYELLPEHTKLAIYSNYSITDIAMPIPEKKYDELPSLSSSDPNERSQALSLLGSATELARHVNTPYIVIWPGYVDTGANDALDTYPENEVIKARQLGIAASLQNLCRSLFEVWKYEPRIVFCIPPAQRYLGIPSIDELEWIIEDLPKLQIKYWHNTAHAFFQEKLTLTEPEVWLEKYGKIMEGIHFEDVLENKPLSPPGLGKVQFNGLRKYLREKTIRVLRADNRFGSDEVWYSWQLLKKMRLV